MRTIEQMVQQEVSCCLSSLVATLANGDAQAGTDLAELCDRALGLAMPVPNYEKAAIQVGWQRSATTWRAFNWTDGTKARVVETDDPSNAAWQALCEAESI